MIFFVIIIVIVVYLGDGKSKSTLVYKQASRKWEKGER